MAILSGGFMGIKYTTMSAFLMMWQQCINEERSEMDFMGESHVYNVITQILACILYVIQKTTTFINDGLVNLILVSNIVGWCVTLVNAYP